MPYVGTVVDGIINAGRLKVSDAIMFGPDSNGKFDSTAIKSIQRKRYVSKFKFPPGLVPQFSADNLPWCTCSFPGRASVESAEAGQCVSLALKRVRRAAVRKGMVIVHKTESGPPRGVFPSFSHP